MPPETAEIRRVGWPTLGLGRSDAGVAGFDAAGLRLKLYAVAFCIAFVLDLLIEGPAQGSVFWVLGVLGTAATLAGLGFSQPLLRMGIIGCLVLSLAVPLVPEMADGLPMDAILKASPLWPQTLVALFASRALSEECDLRFAAFWRKPLRAHASVQLQSGAAAVALGAFLTLIFYQTIWWELPVRSKETTFSAIVQNALTGETIIHRGIIFLFFVIVGYLVDAALHQRRDRVAFRQIQAALRNRAAGNESLGLRGLRAVMAERFASLSHIRMVRLIEEACDRIGADGTAGRTVAAASFGAFHAGSRRFLRGLLPFLPMLGFFGTVVGLATAMAALPTSSPEGAGVDISGSLSGLAVKFQTTLLGIMASLIASALLALLDKSETELAAEAALFVARADDGG